MVLFLVSYMFCGELIIDTSYTEEMKIAQVAPLIESIPPKFYGGTERIVHAITEELVRRGHDVTLFASGDSTTHARHIWVHHSSLREAYPSDLRSRVVYSQLHLSTAYSHQHEFDVIHDHTGHFGVHFAQLSSTPVVMTLHGVITPLCQYVFTKLRKPTLTPISNAQKKPAPWLNYSDTVYNGLDFSEYPTGVKHKGFLLFVGRICPEKGLHYAIEVAKKSGLPLIIAAKYEPEINKAYFEEKIKPHLSSRIQWIGEVNQEERNALFSQALASLHPVTWPEPFGLTIIEAMACGTPVIAFNQGSIPEVIQHNRTGCIVDTVDEMVQAVSRIHFISRETCREYARNTFNVRRMVNGYERIYRHLIGNHVEKGMEEPLSTWSQRSRSFTFLMKQ